MKNFVWSARLAAGLMLGAATLTLGGCFPLVLGGAVTGAMVASDRRTSGMVLEDNNIQLKAGGRVSDVLGDRGHVNVNSYNLQVLITGEVPSAQDKALVEQTVRNVESVRGVRNELVVAGNSSFSQRSSDVVLATRIKALLVDDKDLVANAFKIVTERGTVYAMGRVTQREAKRATEIIRTADGVQRLVIYWEIISEDELSRMLPAPASSAPHSH